MRPAVSIDKILFATDFSEYSAKARAHVLLLASKLGASAVVFHSIELVHSTEPDDPEMRHWYQDLEKQLRKKLDRQLGYFESRQVEAEGELLYGTPWKSIINYAEENSIDLIVVGSHGSQTPEGKLLLGTTSHKVALVSRIPVLIVYAGPAGAGVE